MHAIPLQLKYSSGVLTKKIFKADCPAPHVRAGDALVPACGTRLAWGLVVTLLAESSASGEQLE